MKNLVDLAKQDVLAFLRTNQELLFNERDFQMHLATHLRQTKHYDDVDVEYYVPCDALENYIWNSELRLDILVQKNDEYLPIELKYKCTMWKVGLVVSRAGTPRTGEHLPTLPRAPLCRVQ